MTAGVDQTITEFGQSIGIPGLRLNDQAVLSLAFEAAGTLFIEQVGDSLIIYLARQVDHRDDRWPDKVLKLCHPKHRWPFPVGAGLRGNDTLVFLIKIDCGEFSLPALETALDLLKRLHDKAA